MFSSLGAPLLGILSAASWGGGDFCGGLASKRSPPLGVVAIGAASGLALIAVLALVEREASPPAAALGYAVGAGVAGAIGLGALYRGLAVGRMAVVAPVSAALCAALPVVWGALTEGVPPAAKLMGFALALAGIWLVARADGSGGDRRGLFLALVAGCGFGGFLVLMHAGARDGAFWPVAVARATSCALVLLAAVARRAPWAPSGKGLRLALLSGVLDAGGNALFVLSANAGRLDAAAVLASMYPASTILLATLVLRERVTRPQGAGIAALLVAIVLIAA
ncbi:MAG: EamA family transporter [Anaeromyxobacteraceae bacterium]